MVLIRSLMSPYDAYFYRVTHHVVPLVLLTSNHKYKEHMLKPESGYVI